MPNSLEATVAGMREIIPQNSYYAMTLTADKSGENSWSVQSYWVGFAEDDLRTEIRAGSLVVASRMAEIWSDLKQPYVVVNEEDQLFVYLVAGGNALIERQLAEEYLPEVIAPTPVRCSSFFGYRPISTLSKGAFNRAPSPKQRMRVLKRDKYRCRICGRRADDHVDVELHVHHVKPWGEGGLTVDDNLVTLCHTCHRGLDPHGDFGLAIYLERLDAENVRKQLHDGIEYYRALRDFENERR